MSVVADATTDDPPVRAVMMPVGSPEPEPVTNATDSRRSFSNAIIVAISVARVGASAATSWDTCTYAWPL